MLRIAFSRLGGSYNNAGQTTSITPAGGSATSHSYLDADQDELTTVGATTLQNSVLGVSSSVTGGSTTYYGRTPDGVLVDERGSANRWYVFGGDAVGSIQGVVNGSTGNWIASRSYTPYGETNSASGSDGNPFWYAAGYQGAGGLYHFGKRDYDPGLGRWTQVDPVYQLGNLAESDRYAYGSGNPLNASDPSGAATAAGHCIESFKHWFRPQLCKRAGFKITTGAEYKHAQQMHVLTGFRVGGILTCAAFSLFPPTAPFFAPPCAYDAILEADKLAGGS